MPPVVAEAPITRHTPDDLLQLPDGGKGYELIDGQFVEQGISTLSSVVAGEIFGVLRDHVKPRRLGWVLPEGTSFRVFPDDRDRVRRADTAFIRLDRLTPDQAMAEGHCPVVPDLVVEVVSPHDTADGVNGKRIDWQEAGAKLVWIVHPLHRTVHAYHADGRVSLYCAGDTLDAAPVLPEFHLALSDVFQLPTTA